MVVPSREPGDLLMAVRAEPLLTLPQSEQLPFSSECAFHFHAKAFFEIHFPGGVKRIGFSLYLDVLFDRRVCCTVKSDRLEDAIAPDYHPCKDPVASFMDLEIFVLDPSSGLVVVSLSGPLP